MSASQTAQVFRRLADGRPHSAEALAGMCGIAVSAARGSIVELESFGLEIQEPSAGHFQLDCPVRLLDSETILASLEPAVATVSDVDVLAEAISSNDILLAETAPVAGTLRACVVEYQHAGRGRRGRSWTAVPGGALCMSAGWQFSSQPPGLSALSLAVGVAAKRAIEAVSGVAVGVKWPNDLVIDARKLGGILVELRTDTAGTHVVAGIGINIRVPAGRLATVSDWPCGAIDLSTATDGRVVERNALAATLINELHSMFTVFAKDGFAPFADEWSRAHVLDNAPAVLKSDKEAEHGTVHGVDANGALLFETGGELRRVLAGEVSLRPGS